jgi:hypothetical protein
LRNKTPKRRVKAKLRENRAPAVRKNEVWAMAFVHDQLAMGTKIRVLTIIDTFSRFAPAVEPRFRFRGADVVETLERVGRVYGLPNVIRVDQGTEFVSRDLDLWAYTRGVTLDFSRPGKPTDNAFIESFHGKLRAECLSAHWFMSLDDAKEKCELGVETTTKFAHTALSVPLAKGHNEIRIALTNAIGEKAETLTLTHDGDGDLDKRGTLHILAIGVTDYKGLGKVCGEKGKESCDLDYAGTDARKFADAVEKRIGPGHIQINKRVLVNGGEAKDAPTGVNITDAIERLRQAKETDTVVLFISGHGKNEGPDYRFLATDASWSGGALQGSTVVPWQTLQGAIEAAKGRRILFIDTCHSGNAYNQRLGNAAYHANIVAYTAGGFDQEAMEDPSLKHGLFTYAVVEGLEGKALVAQTGEISTKSLADYIVGRVSTMAKALKGEQVPRYFKGRDAEDFVLARR